GRPFVDWKLDDLAARGASDIVFLVGHRGEEIAAHVGDGSRHGVRVRFEADGDRLLGTGGAIRRALPTLPGAFWVTYGDSLVDVDLVLGEQVFGRAGRPALMTVWRNRGALAPSNALVRGDRVVEYSKSPLPEGAEHIDYGMLLLGVEAFAGT